jgi:hypothetical protein
MAHASNFSNPIELPSMAQADAADRQPEEAIQKLEISEDGQYCKCQLCHKDIKMIGKLPNPKRARIATLERRIAWLEQSPHGNNNDSMKQLKEELAELLEEDAKRDRIRSIPLLTSRITGYRFFCSSCWDNAYLIDKNQRREERKRELSKGTISTEQAQSRVVFHAKQAQEQDSSIQERKTTKQEILESLSKNKKQRKKERKKE